MSRATPALLPLLAPLLLSLPMLGGCAHHDKRGTSDWMKSVNSIKPGNSMDSVRHAIGRPDEKRKGETPVRPYPPTGSPAGVLGTLPPETPYEDWIYRRADSRYHVFFAKTPEEPHKWQVIAVRSAPATDAY